MNSHLIHLVEFAVFMSAMLLIAFRPAWQEWRTPTDFQPLSVSPDYSIDIDYFAANFYTKVINFLNKESTREHQHKFQLIPASAGVIDWSVVRLPVIAMNSIFAKEVISCQLPIFVNGDLSTVGADNLQSLYTQGKISLGPYSRIRDWAHAKEDISLGHESNAPRRLSSSSSVLLGHGCYFERVNAPTIAFGARKNNSIFNANELIESSFLELSGAIKKTNSLTLIRGDCDIPSGRIYHGSLIVTGRLTVGEHSRIIGDVKARDTIVIGAHALIGGALIGEKNIELKEQVCIKGPIISETLITIGADSTVGMHELPTTVSAQRILVDAGVLAHGTVWARDFGVTCPS